MQLLLQQYSSSNTTEMC